MFRASGSILRRYPDGMTCVTRWLRKPSGKPGSKVGDPPCLLSHQSSQLDATTMSSSIPTTLTLFALRSGRKRRLVSIHASLAEGPQRWGIAPPSAKSAGATRIFKASKRNRLRRCSCASRAIRSWRGGSSCLEAKSTSSPDGAARSPLLKSKRGVIWKSRRLRSAQRSGGESLAPRAFGSCATHGRRP